MHANDGSYLFMIAAANPANDWRPRWLAPSLGRKLVTGCKGS
jgi:hypothetical protein